MEEAECYKVEVLHFINPYLIWVEILSPGKEAYFEQIGVYGVLPLEMTMDLTEDTLTTKRSAEWMPAATVLMKNIFADTVEVSFCPLHIDYRSTIFDDNTHKYGDIIIKKSNGKYRMLSKLLVKSNLAIYDESSFQNELASGKIKTKLSHGKIKEIVNYLEKKCKKHLAKQTKVFQTAQEVEYTLTEKNLQTHNRRTKNISEKIEELLQRKLEDIQMCKESDVESVGRATKKRCSGSDSSSFLLKKINLLKGNQPEKSPDVKHYFIQKRIEDQDALQTPTSSKPQGTSDIQKSTHLEAFRETSADSNKPKEVIDEAHKHFEDIMPAVNPTELRNEVNAFKKMQQALKKTHLKVVDQVTEAEAREDSGSFAEVKTGNRSFESDTFNESTPVKVKKPKKSKSSPNKPPDYDVHKETRVAYGPPGTNLTELPCKIVPKENFIETYIPPALREENIPMKEEQEDIFIEEDSDAEIENAAHRFLEKSCRLSDKITDRTENLCTSKILNVADTTTDLSSDNVTSKCESKHQHTPKPETTGNSMLKRKLRHYKEARKLFSPETSDTSTKDSSLEDVKTNKNVAYNRNTSNDLDSDDDNISEVIEKLNSECQPFQIPKKDEIPINLQEQIKNHVNPFKNVDANISKFVEKIVTPVLMVHSKSNKRFQPTFLIRDVPFNSHIQLILKNMSVNRPMMLQSITWRSILRGHSTFMISPKKSGKTMGYLPAVCRLVSDKDIPIDGMGPMSIIVCATSNSVSEIEVLAKMLFGNKEKVLAIYSGMNEQDIVTSLLNGCDMLICTPMILVQLLQVDFGVDLRRLKTFVLDDCEHLSEVFGSEIKFFLFKIKDMLKTRVQREIKVQVIVSSRVWCDFMEPLSKKVPDPVICIGAFQECVLYSKANTSASFVTKENKIKSVLDFLRNIDYSTRAVIVCRTDEEVDELKKALTQEKYIVFACDSSMTVEDLSNLRGSWDEYEDPVIAPILVCLDGNLMQLNVTDAHYLVHYSLPSLFSAFCKRFSVLNDNYPSIFKQENDCVKIKILLEESNVEQLPKILHFIKRCSSEVPTVLDELCAQILDEKDKTKAKKLVPICDNLLTLGECPDFWNCQERHAVVKEVDEPVDWVPKEGLVAFKILHYHSAVFYSARLLSHTVNGQTNKYPQNYNMLAMKISMYFSHESNRQLHGVPKVGDVCAVSIKQNFFVRCQVVKILNYYQNGKPNFVLVRLTDEEKLEKTKDIYLYHLPAELTITQTHVVHVRLANLQPKDKDITFSELAKDQLKKITDGEEDLYMQGQIALTIGNCVILESLEAIRDLSTLNKTVVLHNFKKFLLEKHAILNEEHLHKLSKLCVKGGMKVSAQKIPEIIEVQQSPKKPPTPQWAHLEKDDMSAVLFASAENPSTFFVRLVKFEDSCNVLSKDIQKYATNVTKTVANLCKGDIVLAKLPEDDMFERARIDEITNDEKVKCFFVDQGDWWEVSKKNIIPIAEKLITQLPFQAIECRLVGVKPPGENWTEFATIWFTNCFENNEGDLKQMYAKYFTKEKSRYTGGHKYGVVLVDTNSDEDVVINEKIMEVNLASEKEDEIDYLNKLDYKKESVKIGNDNLDIEEEDSWEKVSKMSKASSIDDFEQPKISLNDVFMPKPIRSMHLIASDESDASEDKWEINISEDFIPLSKPAPPSNVKEPIISNLPAIENTNSKSSSEISLKPCKNDSVQVHASCDSDTDSSIQRLSSTSDIQIVPSLSLKELDSDDLTSPETSLLVTKPADNQDLLKEVTTRKTQKKVENNASKTGKIMIEPLRKSRILWHQKKKAVTIKILLITDKYDLKVAERELKFYAVANDTEYGFDLQLYGIIDKNNVIHANKGQYIRIGLLKIMDRNWLTLTRFGDIQKWIAYDLEAIDVESSDEENDDDLSKEQGLCKYETTDSEDEEFVDDAKFEYSLYK